MPFASRPDAESPLPGGGDMGSLMRALDWSRTPVGAVETWPQSLRTAVSMLLESRFPMYIAWGPEFTQFYNDPYRPILGSTKHPSALGSSTRETFKEIWSIIGPMFEGVMQGHAVGFEDFLLPLDRHGFVEECYFIFSYSPIRDESGSVGGVLVSCTETTERVLGERRLKMLRDLSVITAEASSADETCRAAARAFAQNAADLPFSLVYLFDGDGTHAHLAASSGLAAGAPATPTSVDLRQPAPWPLAEVASSRAALLVDELPPLGPWPLADQLPPTRAMALPIFHAGEAKLAGVLVAGLSARLVLDEKYRGFLELTAGQLGTALDEVRALAEAQARADALAAIDRAKTAFFSNVSHELRTPLTLLLGPTEDALSNAARLPDEDAQRWRLVHRNGLRLLKLVNTLLDFSRIEAGRVQASYEPTDLAELTVDLASQFRAAVERAGLALDVRCPPVGEPVFVDREMWEKIILNLLSNALKFTFEGRIAVALERRDDAVALTVRDTGVGVPAAELPRLFDRFHRVQGARARTHEGTGIGLALVKELVELHRGTLSVESELDRGTTFTVTLPLGSAHLPADRVGAARTVSSTALGAAPFVEEALRWLPATSDFAATAMAALPDERGAGSARVLLADDNADMRDYVGRILGERWQVTAVSDGQAALEAARQSPPDLVLTDVMMPGLDGFQLLRALRADARTRSVPVIFLSARAGDEARVEGLQAGADDYLVKPFSGRELVARVSTHLEVGRLRVEAEHARARLHELFMQAPLPVSVVIGPDHVIELANPLYEKMVARQMTVGQSLRQAFAELPADAPIFQILDEVFRTGQPFSAEEFSVRIDRSGTGILEDVYFKFTSQPIRDGHRVIGIMTVALDVTEQVQSRRRLELAQKQLERQNRINETLYRIGRALNAELDLDKTLQTVTDEATRVCRAQFGGFFYNVVGEDGESYMLYTLSGVPRDAFAHFPMPRKTAIFAPTFGGQRVVRSDDITQDPSYGKSAPHFGMPKGHLPVHSYLAVPVLTRSGEPLGGLFFGHRDTGVFTEEDEQIMAAVSSLAGTAIENARLYQQARAAESRNSRLQSITAALSRAVTAAEATEALLTATMPVIGAAGGGCLLISDDRQHLDVQRTVATELLPVFARLPIDGTLPACEAAREGQVVWVPTREKILERNPEVREAVEQLNAHAWGAVPLSYEGRTIGVATFHCARERELSHADREFLVAAGKQCAQAIVRARLYDETQLAKSEAESASRAKDEFLAMLGHELRNPLAPIQTALQLMRLRGDDSLERERTVIERQVSHVVRLVDDLLDVSRITRGKVDLKRSFVEISEVIAKAIEMASPLMEEHHHRLMIDVPRGGLCVHADPVRLAQVFANLLTNAAKYTGERGEISVEARRDGDEVVTRVRDTGIGIAGDMLPRIFDVFVQERQSLDRAQGGLGLGLTIVRSLVQMHGGTVEARSEGRGRGSEFVVRLSHVASVGEAPRATGSRATSEPRADGLRVLVVDDNVDAADLLAESLRTLGHVAEVAYDGVSALELATREPPQVALLDIGLPVMDGYELGQQLKAANAAVRLVAVTGYGQETDRRRSQAAGFDGHLVKPIHLDEVLSLLDQFAPH